MKLKHLENQNQDNNENPNNKEKAPQGNMWNAEKKKSGAFPWQKQQNNNDKVVFLKLTQPLSDKVLIIWKILLRIFLVYNTCMAYKPSRQLNQQHV